LTDFDYDRDQLALKAFAERLGFAHHFSALPNTGMATGLDLDQNGYLGDARDAQGYGRFSGDGGMAILSDWPLTLKEDFSRFLWRDLDGATMPPMPEDIADIQRLSTAAHWIVRVDHPQPFDLWTYAATPPVFDGPEDRNGLRNRDELRLWSEIMDRDAPQNFIIMGNANLDPDDGDGLRDAMRSFLNDPRIQDPMPRSKGGTAAADPDQTGDPALDTADWPDGKPGNLRGCDVANKYRILRNSRINSENGAIATISHQGNALIRIFWPRRASRISRSWSSVKGWLGKGISSNV